MRKEYKCNTCSSYTEVITDDYADVYKVSDNAPDELLGSINLSLEDEEKLRNGSCPICNSWEDGNGHACTIEGWGKFRVVCEVNYDGIEEKWHFIASTPTFYNETVENIETNTKEEAIEEMNHWIDNYKINTPNALFDIVIEGENSL